MAGSGTSGGRVRKRPDRVAGPGHDAPRRIPADVLLEGRRELIGTIAGPAAAGALPFILLVAAFLGGLAATALVYRIGMIFGPGSIPLMLLAASQSTPSLPR